METPRQSERRQRKGERRQRKGERRQRKRERWQRKREREGRGRGIEDRGSGSDGRGRGRECRGRERDYRKCGHNEKYYFRWKKSLPRNLRPIGNLSEFQNSSKELTTNLINCSTLHRTQRSQNNCRIVRTGAKNFHVKMRVPILEQRTGDLICIARRHKVCKVLVNRRHQVFSQCPAWLVQAASEN